MKKIKKTNLPKKKRGTKPVSKQTLYQVASANSKRAIERLCELMESRNENVALGASKALLNKALPDLRVTEIQGSEKKPLLIELDINESKIHGAGKVPTKTKISI